MILVATVTGDVWEEGSEAARIFWAANAALASVGVVASHAGRLLSADFHVQSNEASLARLALQSLLEKEKTDLLTIWPEQ